MDVNAVLDSLISSANADQSTLNDLIAFLQGQTLVSGSPNQSPPEVDENGVWTLQQLTANAGVDFEGVYQLPAPDACGKLEIVSIDTHQNPASVAPARLKGCVTESEPNPVFVDQPSVSALDGQCMNAFSIRSSVPFDVQMRVVECVEVCGDISTDGGVIVDHPDTFTWVINSQLNPFNQHAVVVLMGGGINDCCVVTDVQITGFAPFEGFGPCGNPNITSGNPAGAPVWRYHRFTGVGGAAFTMTITISAPAAP